ncbi:MAG: gliding motility lipoprotein GldH [Paludibacter sp.]|nr:gliding motility lipoprotein GldH [Paludibacter sp.]
MINLRQIRWHVFVLIVAVYGAISCSRQPVYNEFKQVDPDGWSADSSSVFQVNMEDTSGTYNLTLHIRHTSSYPYQNLWLFVEQLSPDSQLVRDTISCILADHAGKWLGTGTGSVYLFSAPLKKQYSFGQQGIYRYTVVHGMRDEILSGIQAVGLKLENQHGKE